MYDLLSSFESESMSQSLKCGLADNIISSQYRFTVSQRKWKCKIIYCVIIFEHTPRPKLSNSFFVFILFYSDGNFTNFTNCRHCIFNNECFLLFTLNDYLNKKG